MKIKMIIVSNGAAGARPEQDAEPVSSETWDVLLDLMRISAWITHETPVSVSPTTRRP